MGYLFMLLAVFILSLGVGKAMEVHATRVQREREAQLVEVGALYRQAIADYYLSAPDGRHRYPAQLEDLLKDSRHLVTRRYLRQLYPDPMTNKAFMPLPAPQGGIGGVASTSMRQPIRSRLPAGITPRVSPPRSYSDWQFVSPASPAATPPAR